MKSTTATKKILKGFTDEERVAMKECAQELAADKGEGLSEQLRWVYTDANLS